MEYVVMVAFVISLIFFLVMLTCGIIVNMYLYTHGMFRGHRTSRHSHAFGDWDEDYLSVDVTGRHDVTGNYVRKGLLLTFAAIVLACFIMITLLIPAWH
jgi:hypothetical protein